MKRVVIIDYGSGNLHSAHKAVQRAADDAGIAAGEVTLHRGQVRFPSVEEFIRALANGWTHDGDGWVDLRDELDPAWVDFGVEQCGTMTALPEASPALVKAFEAYVDAHAGMIGINVMDDPGSISTSRSPATDFVVWVVPSSRARSAEP